MSFFGGLWNGIRRAFTLPKSADSISKIAAQLALSPVVRDILPVLSSLAVTAIDREVSTVFADASRIDSTLQGILSSAVNKALGGSLNGFLQDQVDNAIQSAFTSVRTDLATLKTEVLTRVNLTLGLKP